MWVDSLQKDVEMWDVSSSNVESVGYDHESQTLFVKFLNGTDAYFYNGVDQSVYDGMMSAPSIGSYFYQNVRRAGYEYGKIPYWVEDVY